MDINGENSLSLPFFFFNNFDLSDNRMGTRVQSVAPTISLIPSDSEIVFEFLVVYFLMECIIFLQYDASARYTGLSMLEAKLQTNLLKL